MNRHRGTGTTAAETSIVIRPFEDRDATSVQALFVAVNRLLAPPALREAFEAYIARARAEEIDRIGAYYAEHHGGFWVALRATMLVGMFGLERAGADSFELRRMYVAPQARRSGIARRMLHFAEDECRRRRARRLELSTSELQPAALALYRAAGYRLLHEVIAEQSNNKTFGSGLRRYHFEKPV
ncbi:MAG: GNAT family N-acetyltransferase [Acetobacteraceae bacterium]